MKRFLIAVLIFGAALLAHAADPVPIYEREPPTDPKELEKYYEELGKAVQAAEQGIKDAGKKAVAAALAPKASNPQAADLEIPERDEARIKIASSRKLTAQTIDADVAGLLKQLRAGLDGASVADADAFVTAFGASPAALANAAAISWVQEAPGTALLLAAEAAQRSPGNANALNTLAALLSDAGYVDRGIPILVFLAAKYPDDPTLLNNLGQAWLGVGAPELAKPYLLACIARAPLHGPANAAMGVITYCAGDQTAATSHFQTAAASSSSPVARRALDRLDAPYTLPRSFRRIAPVQEYFNPRHFVPPAGQETLSQAETKRAEIVEFTRLVKDRMNSAEAALAAANGRMPTDAAGMATLAFRQSVATASELGGLDLKHISGAFEGQGRRAAEFQRDVDQFISDAGQIWETAENAVGAVRTEFAEKWRVAAQNKEIGEGGAQNEAFVAESKQLCVRCRTIMGNALPAIANKYNSLVAVVSTRERVAINEELTYLPLIFGGDLYRTQFYALVLGHLQRVAVLGGVNPIHTYECGPVLLAEQASPAVGDLPVPGPCPIKLKVNFRVAKLKLDCTSVGIEVEAGLKFSAKKNFSSGETTLTGGVGVDMGLANVGQVEGSGQFVVVWDRGNNLGFVGVQSSASASLSGIPGLDGSVDTGEGSSVGGSTSDIAPNFVNVGSETTLGVTLGPRGAESTLKGSAGVEVLGQNLVKAEL